MTFSSVRNLITDRTKIFLCLIFGALLLTGCEGPSTTVLPAGVQEGSYVPQELSAEIPQANYERLMDTVDILYSAGNSDVGNDTEAFTDAAVYIVSALRGCSYDVNQAGEIIEAVLNAGIKDPDICLIFACYGMSDAGTFASDTAAGAAVLLETAEVLSGMSGDTEIHFVFLPGERKDTEHIYTYLTEIFTPDPDRLVGAVILGGLGLNEAAENELGCIDARATFMAEQIIRICEEDLGKACECIASSVGLQNALLRNSIPSVVYGQRETIEAGTVLDCPTLLDYGYLQESTDILSHTLALLLGDTTPSMQARAHYTDAPELDEGRTFALGKNDSLPFGKSESEFETLTGLIGERISENTVNSGGELSGYRFLIDWFGRDDVLPADFYYLSDALQNVRIRAFEEGVDYSGMYDAIKDFYGEGSQTSEGPYGVGYEWMIPAQRLHITLQPKKEGYDLILDEYDTPVYVYPPDSLGTSRLKGLFEQVIPEQDREDISFEAYTDGYGATLGRLTAPPATSANAGWVLGLDLDDSLMRNADFKDKTKTVNELVRLYGEYLAEKTPSEYYDGYHSRFGGDIDDFASSFCLFSLSGTPMEEIGPAADPVRYFYDFDELKSFRDSVRSIR